MKKVLQGLLIAAIAAAPMVSNAQLEKGNWMVGSSLTNINFGLGNRSNFNLSITPRVGYFIQNNVAIGGFVNMDYSTAKGQGNIFAYDLGAFGRYYFNKNEVYNPLRDGRFFLEGQVGIGGTNGTGVGASVAFGPGYAYFITPNVALEALVQVKSRFGVGSNTGLNIGVGFQIYLPSAKLRAERAQIEADLN